MVTSSPLSAIQTTSPSRPATNHRSEANGRRQVVHLEVGVVANRQDGPYCPQYERKAARTGFTGDFGFCQLVKVEGWDADVLHHG